MRPSNPEEFRQAWERIDDPAAILEAMTKDQLAEDELASRLENDEDAA